MPLAVPVLTVSDPLLDVTAVTYTVAGGNAGAANVLYRSSWDGSPGSLSPASFAAFTGNAGPVNAATSAGFYWWYLTSTLAGETVVSNFVYRPILSTTQKAVQTKCIEAIVVQLKALNLPLLLPERIFQAATADELMNTNAACLVFRTFPPVEVGGNNNRDDIQYSFQVCFTALDSMGQAAVTSGNLAAYDLWHQSAREFRNRRLTGVPESEICHVELLRVAEQDQEKYNLVKTAYTVKAVCRERRGGFA